MASRRYSTLPEEQREMDEGLFDARMQPVVKLYRIDFLHLCKDVVSLAHQERSRSLVQDEPEPPQIKQEHDKLLQRPGEAHGSTLTLLAVISKDDDENRETEPVASTSTHHMKTQGDVEDYGTSQPTRDDQLLSSHSLSESESDTEDSDEWDETRENQTALNTLKSHKTKHVKGQRSLSHNLSQDLKSSKQSHSSRSHKGTKSFSCTECGQMFNRQDLLKRHTLIHTGERPLSCTVCGKGCYDNGQMKDHMRTHTGEKPFTCTVCGKGYSQSSNLKAHMRIHTGEKPNACTVCGKGFGHMGDLKKHMRTHTGERPFACSICGKGFIEMAKCRRHMHIHTASRGVERVELFTCTVCGKGFRDIKAHMRTHTGEKPYSCTVCGTSYRTTSNLKSHMRTHTGEKPFTCTVCGKGFGQMAHVKQHMRTHCRGELTHHVTQAKV